MSASDGQWDTAALVAADKRCVWHPFTNMAGWCASGHEPLVLVRGEGAWLWDSEGRRYLDGNSSIWTNIHGHNHPHINAAIREQLDRVAHTSFLGFTNPAAIELAERIVAISPVGQNARVFFSDDGSTGMEVALRIVEQFWRLQGQPRREFIAFRDAYHGDTAGAASLGACAMFGLEAGEWRPPVRQVASIADLSRIGERAAALVIEPLVQGAAGMKLWPKDTLRAVREFCDRTGTLLIADEVLTGFGRTGKMFACEHEQVRSDIIVLGKALTGGYLPLALTVIAERIFEPFRNRFGSEATLFYGHSYTGNALGCAAALASLEVFERENVLEALSSKIRLLQDELARLEDHPAVKQVRQSGFVSAIELREGDARDVCLAARQGGLLTRSIRESIIFMPPFCITEAEIRQGIAAIEGALDQVSHFRSSAPRTLQPCAN